MKRPAEEVVEPGEHIGGGYEHQPKNPPNRIKNFADDRSDKPDPIRDSRKDVSHPEPYCGKKIKNRLDEDKNNPRQTGDKRFGYVRVGNLTKNAEKNRNQEYFEKEMRPPKQIG